nr:hypothetical protein [Tanacetum cinerariifolium]
QLEILKLKARVKKLERLNKVKSSKLIRLKKVGTSQRIKSSEDLENVFNQERELHGDTPAETLSVKDKGKGILVEVPKPMKKKDQIEMDAEYARKLQEEEESNVQAKDVQAKDVQAKDVQAKGIQEEMGKEKEEIIKSINETPVQKAEKRRRLSEQAKEAKDLKKQLEVVVDEDDDVFIEATPISRKVPVVNYEIVMINNKPRCTRCYMEKSTD